MKTLAMLLLTTLHLCYMFGISTGAVLIRDISEINNPEIKEFLDQGIKSITQLILDEVQHKKDTSLQYGLLVEGLRKDIVQHLSSSKFAETDKIMSINMPDTEEVSKTIADSSKNDIAGLSCNWDENTFKCCQSSVPVGSNCLAAEVFNDRIKLSRHSEHEIVWTRFLSYKSNIERTIRNVSKQVYEANKDFESINWGDIFEHSMILTEQADDEEEADTAVGGEELTATVTAEDCSWNGMVGQCWIVVDIDKSYNVSFKVEIEPPALVKLSLSVNKDVLWSQEIGIGKNTANVCIKWGICFQFSWSGDSQLCLRVTKLLGIKIKMRPLCIKMPFVKAPNSSQNDIKQDDTLPLSNYLHENIVLTFK